MNSPGMSERARAGREGSPLLFPPQVFLVRAYFLPYNAASMLSEKRGE